MKVAWHGCPELPLARCCTQLRHGPRRLGAGLRQRLQRPLQPGRQAEVQGCAQAAQDVVCGEQGAHAAGQRLAVGGRHAAAPRDAGSVAEQRLGARRGGGQAGWLATHTRQWARNGSPRILPCMAVLQCAGALPWSSGASPERTPTGRAALPHAGCPPPRRAGPPTRRASSRGRRRGRRCSAERQPGRCKGGRPRPGGAAARRGTRGGGRGRRCPRATHCTAGWSRRRPPAVQSAGRMRGQSARGGAGVRGA